LALVSQVELLEILQGMRFVAGICPIYPMHLLIEGCHSEFRATLHGRQRAQHVEGRLKSWPLQEQCDWFGGDCDILAGMARAKTKRFADARRRTE
jgi:hypothetical protein